VDVVYLSKFGYYSLLRYLYLSAPGIARFVLSRILTADCGDRCFQIVFDLSLFVLRMKPVAHRALHRTIEWPRIINELCDEQPRDSLGKGRGWTRKHPLLVYHTTKPQSHFTYGSEPTTPSCRFNIIHVTEFMALRPKCSILNLHREVPAEWLAHIRSEYQSSSAPSAGASHFRRRVFSRTRRLVGIRAQG
jgi:hypothetical protein